MFRRKPVILGSALGVVALVTAACGSAAPGSSGGGGSGSTSSAATAAAKTLGIDLSKCGADPTKPLTGTVNVGETLPLTGGPAAAFAPIGQAIQAEFDAFNATSGLKVKFHLIQADDQFDPAKALTATQQLIAQDKVVAMTSTIGTPSVMAVEPLLNQECIPMVTGLAGGASADDPAKYPWTTILALPSAVDVRAWVENLAAQHPNGAKVGLFYANDASGQEYLAAVKHYLAGTKSTLVSSQSIEDSDSAAPASQVTTLRASGATVLMAAPTGGQCLALMQQVASVGWNPTTYMSSSCPASLFDLAAAAANGVYVNVYIKDPSRPPFSTDAGVAAAEAAFKKYEPSLAVSNVSISGWAFAEPFFAAVKAAAASPLGLTSLGLLVATTHLNFQPTTTYPGVRFDLSYPTGEVAMESEELTRYNSHTKQFAAVKFYNFNGQMTGIASTK